MAIEVHHLQRIGQGKGWIEIVRQPRGIDAAPARVARIAEHGEAKLDLGVGEPIRGGRVMGVEAGGLGQTIVRGP